ncbi:hypothetical protein QFC19_002845 [Naganishia cerealis]|uniref:Uncharacterized protein n=1 Tax=Naganishia cerealis TaxID=610337 RepID=A0ACC2W620_9TREE|nr:hypothetical protein QFC19_002845 [Naganishia cerealis]
MSSAIRKVAVIMGTLETTLSSLPGSAIAHAFPGTDAGNPDSICKAWEGIKQLWPDGEVDVAVFNPGGKFAPGPFLERDVNELRDNLETGV